ncbi:AI-2E family transporter [Verrucomicrobium sp. BvORR106]|uniref:AI-2E family transporter n=1 Tax=Verrucomicrobium sp. BvORR106 TaxID=1403819 RepID=UPI000570EBF9|nr:AI-2E family transporter [Verrucomicrobium sp. BvORR106]
MDAQQRSYLAFLRFFTALLLVAALYFAQEVLVPLALSALLAFMLNPLVKLLCRCRLPRTLSVVIVTMLVFTLMGCVFWMVGKELHHLANALPNYRHNIQERVSAVRNASEGGTIARLRSMVADISTSALDVSAGRQKAVSPSAPASTTPADQPPSPPDKTTPAPQPAPPPVEGGMASKILNGSLAFLANGLGVAAVVIVFVIFMLLRQEDISHRIVGLAGFSRLTTTSRAMDEIGGRISRYLLMLATVNSLYGVMLAIGLAFIGLPYVLLWGVLAALFRFIPYIGPWIVAVLPIGLSLAVFDGWTQPLMVAGLIIGLELLTNMVLEPLLYGHSVGVSDFALLVAITFWTWLWGGLGLVLATPLTVCIVVICKYIPSLAWVDVLMGEKQPPQAHLMAFRRLVAGDEDAFQSTIQESFEKNGVEATLDQVVLPALVLTRREAMLGKLDEEEQKEVIETIQATSQYLRECQAEAMDEARETEAAAAAEAEEKEKKENEENLENSDAVTPVAEVSTADEPVPPPIPVFARALHGQVDALALEMLEILLPPQIELQVSADDRLIGELVENLNESRPALMIISAMRPGSIMAAETLCRRLHHKIPGLKLLVCRWGLPGQQSTAKSLKDAGATWVATTLEEARNVIVEATDVQLSP